MKHEKNAAQAKNQIRGLSHCMGWIQVELEVFWRAAMLAVLVCVIPEHSELLTPIAARSWARGSNHDGIHTRYPVTASCTIMKQWQYD